MGNDLSKFIEKILSGDVSLVVKTVKGQQNSGIIYLNKKFIGKKVAVILKNET